MNDTPTIVVTANDFTEDSAGVVADAVVATYVTSDEVSEGNTLTVSFTGVSNDDGYYALDAANNQVLLTAAGVARINGGFALPAVDLTVTDNGTPVASSTGSDTPVVTLVNDAPMLDSSKSPAFTAVLEDNGAPVGAVGTLVSQLVDFTPPAGGLDNVRDMDAGALLGIAVTATNSTDGTWHYSLNGGTSWTVVGTVSNASALLLAADANTRLYFQGNSNFNGSVTDGVTFRAWDQTSGTAGNKIDTTSNGGTTAFSAATDTVSQVVTPVNDAPVGVNDTSASMGATAATEKGGIANGTAGNDGSGNVLANDTDVDTATASLTVTAIRTGATEGAGTAGTVGIGLVGAHGTLTLNSNGSYTYVVNENDVAFLTLNAGQSITDTFNYTVSDGSLIDVATLTVTINGANDGVAPTDVLFAGNAGLSNTGTGNNSAIAAGITLLSLGAVDPDGGGFTFTNPTGGNTFTQTIGGGTATFTISGNTLTTSALAYSGVADFTLNVRAVDNTSQFREEPVHVWLGNNKTGGGETLGLAAETADQVEYAFNGDDVLVAGKGSDWLNGGSGADTYVFGLGTSLPLLGGSGDAGTIRAFDTVSDFALAGVDKLDIPGTAAVAANTVVGVNGTDSLLTIAGQTVKSHSINNGIISFDDADTYLAVSNLTLSSTAGVAAVVDYLLHNDLGNAGVTVAFTATISGVNHTYVYTQDTTNAGATGGAEFVDLSGITATSVVTTGTAAGSLFIL